MCIDIAEFTVHDVARIGFPISVTICHSVDIGDAVNESGVTIAEGRIANRNVESTRKVGDFCGTAISPDPLNHRQAIARIMVSLARKSAPRFHIPFGWIGIFNGVGDPKPSARVEVQIHRLADVGVGNNQLNFKSWREMKHLQLLFGAQRLRRSDSGCCIRNDRSSNT